MQRQASPDWRDKSRIICDTDVVSYLFGDRPQAAFFRPYLVRRTLAISFMTVGQLYFGAMLRNWGQPRIGGLEAHLKNYVVIPYDDRLCRTWASIRATRQMAGHQISESDAWIAAGAIVHDCALATNNTRDFVGIANLALISP